MRLYNYCIVINDCNFNAYYLLTRRIYGRLFLKTFITILFSTCYKIKHPLPYFWFLLHSLCAWCLRARKHSSLYNIIFCRFEIKEMTTLLQNFSFLASLHYDIHCRELENSFFFIFSHGFTPGAILCRSSGAIIRIATLLQTTLPSSY